MEIIRRANAVHTSPIGLIPKKGKPGQWYLIIHLSSPDGGSVNDGIDQDMASLKYPTVDHLAMLVQQVSRGTYLVKADVKEAFRNIPIHPNDRWLLGMEWVGSHTWTRSSTLDSIVPPRSSQPLLMRLHGCSSREEYPTFSTTLMIL